MPRFSLRTLLIAAAVIPAGIYGLVNATPLIASLAKSGDIVVNLGAGSISQWAYALPDQLAKLGKK